MNRTRLTTACWSVLLVLGLVGPVNAANIYRYQDATGRTVFNSMIPPEYVKNGYTILNEQGRVVEVVPPAPSEEEIAARAAAAEAQRAEEEALREQMAADNLLLRLYRSPEEIARKRDERLRQLDAQLAGLRVTIDKLDSDIAGLEKSVASARASQLEPAATVVDSLGSKMAERERFTAQRNVAEAEKEKVARDAERDIARLSELLNGSE